MHVTDEYLITRIYKDVFNTGISRQQHELSNCTAYIERTGPGNGQQSPDGGVSGAETKATDRQMCTRVWNSGFDFGFQALNGKYH